MVGLVLAVFVLAIRANDFEYVVGVVVLSFSFSLLLDEFVENPIEDAFHSFPLGASDEVVLALLIMLNKILSVLFRIHDEDFQFHFVDLILADEEVIRMEEFIVQDHKKFVIDVLSAEETLKVHILVIFDGLVVVVDEKIEVL